MKEKKRMTGWYGMMIYRTQGTPKRRVAGQRSSLAVS